MSFFSIIQPKHYSPFIIGFLSGQVLNAIYMIAQFFLSQYVYLPATFYNFAFAGQPRAFGLLGEPSYVAISLVPAIFYLASKYKHTKSINFITPILLLASVLTYSRAVYLCLIIMIILFTWQNSFKQSLKTVIFGTVLALIVGVTAHPHYFGINLQDLKKTDQYLVKNKLKGVNESTQLPILEGSASERVLSVKRGINIFLQNPVWGVGLGNSKEKIVKAYLSSPSSIKTRVHRVQGLHNLFLEILVEIGFVGLLVFVIFIFRQINQLITQKKYSMLGTLLLCGIAMQFAQNINMPTMWILIFGSQATLITPRKQEAK